MRTIDTVNSTIPPSYRTQCIIMARRRPRPGIGQATSASNRWRQHCTFTDGAARTRHVPVGLLALISSLRDRVARRLNVAIGVVCCFEARAGNNRH
jgi:hypothetical protein